MQIFWKKYLFYLLFIRLWFGTAGLDEKTETCAELQLLDKDSAVAIFDVSGDNYVNISFVLSTHTCTYNPQWFRVKVATSTQDHRFPFCTILFQNLTCSVTDHSKECHCVHTDQRLAWVYRKVSPDEKLQILEWTDAQAFGTPKEKIAVFNFSNQQGVGEKTTTCAELQVLDKDLAVAVFDVSGDNYVNISFVLSTHTCTYHPQWFRVKVATSTQDRRFPFCTILFQNLTCSVTDHSKECHCVHTDQRLAWVYRRVSPEEKLQILEWTDAQAFATPKEKIIVFNFLNQAGAESGATLPTITIALATSLPLLLFIIVALVFIIIWRVRVSGQRADNVTVYRSEEETHYCSIGNIEVQCREASKLEKNKPCDDYANTSHTASSTNAQVYHEKAPELPNEYMEPTVHLPFTVKGFKTFLEK
ncbi:uncharacterized protein LOC112568799 isoform X1 [Pomacea canaliculata]|uniref:uncharacterized protein LOC112568799 isoform X1 n=1 Tax=Pomacea canaliculata TaxID=400727 RepID=UPI000D7258F1|nr:uncharacterized protein LOC112568799 isoform X1 [Pomacea canaliculata]